MTLSFTDDSIAVTTTPPPDQGPWYFHPTALVSGPAASVMVAEDAGAWLAGGPLAFTAVEVLVRQSGGGAVAHWLPWAAFRDWARCLDAAGQGTVAQWQQRVSAARAPFAGLSLDQPRVMGVVNVTPDSFSDGGRFADTEAAVVQARALAAAGADLLDVGGESTRPGAVAVPPAEEQARILPVIAALRDGPPVSVDTRHAETMAAALHAGARVVNDVTALSGDPDSLPLVASRQTPVVLMHMQGSPQTMQDNPAYACAPLDVYDTLAVQVAACEAAGLSRHQLAVDPGIGFGKTAEHNCMILHRVALLHGLGCAVLIGASRKSLIARLAGDEAPADRRMAGSVALALRAAACGVSLLRVHDVSETIQALRVWTGVDRDGL